MSPRPMHKVGADEVQALAKRIYHVFRGDDSLALA